MPDHAWKKAERRAAALIGGRRHWANSGEKIDCESDAYVAQCKEVKALPLAQLEALALEVERQGLQRTPPKLGLVIVKRRGGFGVATPTLITMTAATFREMNGARALADLTRAAAPTEKETPCPSSSS